MKLSTSPLIIDIDSAGNLAPTVTPGAAVTPLTINISGMEGRVEDLWSKVQAIWVRYTFTLTQAASATVLNYDKLGQAIDSFQVTSPILGDLVAQRSGQGGPVHLIDQVFGAGHRFPTPVPNQLPSTAQDNTVDLYYRIPFANEFMNRPQDGGIWAPFFEKGKLIVNAAPTTADFFQTKASVKAAAATVRAAFEVLPEPQPIIHTPQKWERFEFNTSATQLRLFNFGSGDGLLGVNPGARLAALLWLSSLNGLGGVSTVDKWSRLALQWRRQKLTNNPEFFMASFLAAMRTRVAPQGSYGSTVTDVSGWPYQMGGGPANGLLDSSGLFFPLVWPGYDSALSGFQKQGADLLIDAGFSANPNGTHVFRAFCQYSHAPTQVAKLMGLMGFSTKTHTVQAKLSDNTDPRQIPDSQKWGLPLRILPRGAAVQPLI